MTSSPQPTPQPLAAVPSSSGGAGAPRPPAPADLAGAKHWDAVWERRTGRRLPTWSYYTARIGELFRRHVPAGGRLIEIGAGNSRWLPYLATAFGCEVWGIDYSHAGVDATRQRLAADGVGDPARVVYGDVFAPQPELEGRFDVLWSFGFVEHFDDLPRTVARLADYLRPGGVMITAVPNMHGAVGALHRFVDPEVFAMHQRIDPARLDATHAAAGLGVVEPGHYRGLFSIGVVNCERLRRRLPAWLDRPLWAGVLGLQQAVCLPFRVIGVHPDTRAFSPYVAGVYRKAR